MSSRNNTPAVSPAEVRTFATWLPVPRNVQEAIKFAEERLAALGKEWGLDTGCIHSLLGAPAPEIRSLAEEIGADAIVIGSHGHSGWKILLGSTAIKVLHGAHCDVLTVHVG